MPMTMACLFCLLTTLGQQEAASPALWVYASVNFQVSEDAERFIALLERSKKAGYSAAVVTDYKFGKLDERPQRYYDNLRRAKEAAERLDIELIPCVCPIGYSNSLLQNDPNLAAGLPVKDCVFVVQNGTASVADRQNLLAGGEFETAQGDRPTGWDWIDGFGQATVLDESTKHGGSRSLKMHQFDRQDAGNCRVVKKVKLKPWHQYRVTLWAKTRDLGNSSDFRVMPLTDGGPLSYAHVGLQSTQDWSRHRVCFNSLDNEQATLYVGVWSGRRGTIWLDDVVLEEVGGVNLVRRDACPLTVTSEDGTTVFDEGRDFERWHDPRLGMVPYAGEFDDDHDAPVIRLTENSRIQDGQRLRISFYHTSIIHEGQVTCALIDDEVFRYVRKEVELVNKYLQPKTFFMQHDEIRVGGFDQQETQSGKTSGELLAENARRCTEIIHSVATEAKVIVWSDMFDPHHNAVDDYYLVRGSLAGSWNGLAPEVGIVNWNSGKAKQSLAFFAERGHQQIIAGYYDSSVSRNLRRWGDAATGIKNIRAYMYTTWRRDYSKLEQFAELVRGEADPSRAPSR